MQGGENVVSCIYNVACPGYGAYFYICMPVGPRLRGSVRRPGCRENGPGTEKSCEKERGTSMAKSGKNRMLPAVIGCVAVQLCVGILYVWSVFKQPAISFFGWDGGSVNLVASFMLFCFCFGNLIGGILQDRIGPKPVCIAGVCLFGGGILISSFLPACAPIALFYLAYCLVAGVGSGFAYGAVLSCIQKWFPHKRGFASGLGAGAFGLSTVVFSPVIQKLLGAVGLSMTLRILAIIFLAVGILACLFISLPDAGYLAALGLPKAKAGGDDGSKTLSQAIRTLPFWLLFLGCFLFNGTWNMLTPLIKDLGVERGLSDSAAFLCVSLTGLANAAGRLIMASLSDKLGRIRTLYVLCAATIVCALLLIAVPGGAYMAVVLLTAFAYGGPAAVNPATSTDFFGPRCSGTNYGVIMLALGLSSVVFNALSNALYAATGAYTLTFIVGAVTAAVSIAVYYAISRLMAGPKAG